METMKRKYSAREIAACFRVKRLLELLKHPELGRSGEPEDFPTVEEYRKMDRTLSIMEFAK